MELPGRVLKRRYAWNGLVYISVGLVLTGWLLNTPGGLLGKADAIAYAVCHRIDLRSFHIGDRQMPLCARCTGMYLGAMVGLFIQWLYKPRRVGMPPIKFMLFLGALVVAFGVDGLNSFLHFFPGVPTLYQPQNYLRLLTGTGMGLVIAAFLFPAFNQTVWNKWDSSPALSNWHTLVVFTVVGLFMDLLVLSGNPLLLYPLAIISASGVLVLLTMIYTMVILMVFRRENRYRHLSDLFVVIMGGFGFALLQISTLDIVRYLLTGTWGGFHLG
jgi:uncharacterized membrane protein